MTETLEIFLVTVPGLEASLEKEAIELGYSDAAASTGGVTVTGTWIDVWRFNLMLRGASHVLVRIASFRVVHLAKLDKQANRIDWRALLSLSHPVRVEATCKKSRIYHHKAASQRIEDAIKGVGIEIDPQADICIKARILDDLCTISIDTSGDSLHKRGHKQGVNKAPMRENIAALLIKECGFTGDEPVLDPMCGSGTFVIEAAEIAQGLLPGRSRTFAFEKLLSFDPVAWDSLRSQSQPHDDTPHFYGFDRNDGAIELSRANAERAGVAQCTVFEKGTINALKAPGGAKGLVIINPPYGVRLGEIKRLGALYKAMGSTLAREFVGWRIGLITSSDSLAQATGLPFSKTLPFSHGGLSVKLYQTEVLV
ncbi:class I SAM-dependent RNA methyltransferase [Temperatibacter marinus]|uniref:Class I SAM-dependent RNA methyltransferase n=1 Tax=Temperatibacter marinus TaxID=1456591 RepID=A0AA52EIS0_9PROT|nr:class I SAM-dependent RNA methyltransferase [Temperatibacter marinus]WND03565.1 class I SAM-dependent RNA methyltransferase [Temperatibacter marinus]